MKLSLNWLRDYLDIHKTPAEIADILTSLGLEVEGWDEVKPSAVDLDKVRSGIVLECERIPDTDHLSATKVDAGDGVIRSIVCGAPNVAAGQKVWVALPGANVFSKDGSLFTIAERKVRGIASQGMICAEDELGLGHDHAGIMVLPADTPVGLRADNFYQRNTDTVLEIGLTPNRADATNHLGVARDLLAWMRHHENPSATLRTPDTSTFTPGTAAALPVLVENTEACPRYAGITLRGVKVEESPEWLQQRLLAVGQRPINNVVDITNYVRIETGQPLHAFDLAAIRGAGIRVKTLPEGTQFVTLDGTERKLHAEDLMICDALDTPLCIAGVFGGAHSGVTETTTDVFLESACFNARYIRRTMLRHGLRTDAAWSFEKGVDPNGTIFALQRAAQLIENLAGGKADTPITDLYPDPVAPAKVAMRYDRINSLIGENLSAKTIKNILLALEIGISHETAESFTALIPTNKPDVTREADVVEEILRVHGLDTVPIPTQIRSSMEVQQRPNPDAIRNFAADSLATLGYLECMNMSLSNSAYYRDLLPVPADALVMVHNTANQGLDCMRPTLLMGGLETIRHNQNRQNPDVRLFEFGKTFVRQNAENGPKFRETLRLSILISGAHNTESWQPSAKKQVDFYTLKTVVNNLLQRLGIAGYQETTLNEAPYNYALKYHRGEQELVTFGQVQTSISKKMDIKNAVFFADFNFDNVLKALGVNKISFTELNKFPTVRRDLALVLDRSVGFGDIRQLALKTAKKALRDVNLFDVFEDEKKLGEGKKSYAVSFTFEDHEKTLQDKDIDALMQQLQYAFESKLKASIRQ
ncbi:MAG: phenylalanine--tRNA ligase subunit beta [Saprospiraceae bacterium]|nr:phenylalanine--tRNA ligase subunit beta [Saprospiraceae bacterium]